MELKHGIASPSTITRMLCGIDEELALYAFMEWIGEIADSKNTHLAIDGKALRGATEKTKGGTAPGLYVVFRAGGKDRTPQKISCRIFEGRVDDLGCPQHHGSARRHDEV